MSLSNVNASVPLDCLIQSFFDRHARLPPQHFFRPRDVRPAGFRIVHRQWAVFDLAAASGQPQDQLREFEDGHLVRIAYVDRLVELHVHQPPDAFDQVVDVLEASRLATFAEDRQRLAMQSLIDERRNDAAIVDAVARAISIMASHSISGDEILEAFNSEIVDVRSRFDWINATNHRPYQVSQTCCVQSLRHTSVPGQNVEIRDFANRDPVERIAAAGIATNPRLGMADGSDYAKAHE